MSVIRRVHKIGNCGLNHPRAWDSGHYTPFLPPSSGAMLVRDAPLLEVELNKRLRHSEKVTQVVYEGDCWIVFTDDYGLGAPRP